MRRALLVVLLVTVALPAAAAGRTLKHVRFDLRHHRVAGLKLDSATKAQVRRRFGKPDRIVDVPYTPTARRWEYSCGRDCTLDAQIRAGKLRLVWAFVSSSRRHRGIKTTAGSFLGLSRERAERREGETMQAGCVTELVKSAGDYVLQVSANSGYVDSLLLHGPHDSVDC